MKKNGELSLEQLRQRSRKRVKFTRFGKIDFP